MAAVGFFTIIRCRISTPDNRLPQPPLATSSLAATIIDEFLHAARANKKRCKQDLALNPPGSLNKEFELRLYPSQLNARTPPINPLRFKPQSHDTRSQILSCFLSC